MWLLPSRGRPHLAQRLFDNGNFKTPGLLILDHDDSTQYESVRLPDKWDKVVFRSNFLSGKINNGFRYRPNEQWYGVLNDDHLPKTENWDTRLVDALKGPLVWPQDNYADRISTPVMCGDFARKLGWVACPDLKHFYLDDVNELFAKEFGCKRLDSVMVSHEHVNKGRMPPDKTYMERPPMPKDRQAYQYWLKEKWPKIKTQLKIDAERSVRT